MSCQVSSPRLQSRGPIATYGPLTTPPPFRPLHGYKAVAPLRPTRPVSSPRRASSSPRLQSRGPIATCQARSGRPPVRVLSTATKPWPHCDSAGPRGRATKTGALHGYKAVAPLRRVALRELEDERWVSPRLQSRGPIATVEAASAQRVRGLSPRLQSRGPIATPTLGGVLPRHPSPRLQSRGPIATRRHSTR